jgi:hypothetical protein
MVAGKATSLKMWFFCYHKASNDIWISDIGAFVHYCNSSEGIFNLKEFEERSQLVNAIA